MRLYKKLFACWVHAFISPVLFFLKNMFQRKASERQTVWFQIYIGHGVELEFSFDTLTIELTRNTL